MQTEWTKKELIQQGICILCENLEERAKVLKQLQILGFTQSGKNHDNELCVTPDDEGEFTCYEVICSYQTPLTASKFLTPPNPELIKLKKQLLEIADKDRGEPFLIDEVETDNYNAITEYIAGHRQSATDIANLIINSEI